MPRVPAVALIVATAAGCAVGPRAVETGRLEYNQAVKSTTEQQLLLNIVRLRYTEPPSSLAVASIADQQEIVRGLQLTPFFTSAAAGQALGGYRGSVLPGATFSRADRPTVSYDPQDDLEFTRRLFTPISLEGLAYLGKATWPIATVFRLFLENLNWVSNAQTASGPTPREVPEYAQFRAGVDALQRLQDRNLAVLTTQERDDPQTDALPETANTPTAAVEAVKAGCEFRKTDKGWAVVRKKFQPVLRVADIPASDGDFATFAKAFRLDPTRRSFDVTGEKVDPFLTNAPDKGLDKVDLETRSLLQVLFFVAHGVDVPAADLASGVAPDTAGGAFDWQQVLGGLFQVKCCPCAGRDPPPACAAVAVQYRGHWFYVNARDRDTKATFALLVELTRLDTGGKTAPLLTLPLGGR